MGPWQPGKTRVPPRDGERDSVSVPWIGQSLSRPWRSLWRRNGWSCPRLIEWSDWLKTRACDIADQRAGGEVTQTYAACRERLTGCIDAHNEEDIRLESCCKARGLPVRLGKRAGEVHDATFSGYLLASRIAKSKPWLRHTEMSIDEMASRLQYSNVQSFSRFVQVIVDIPPGVPWPE